MWLFLGIGAVAYYLWSRSSDASKFNEAPGVRIIDGVQRFDADAKAAILSALPMLAMEQVSELDGVKAYRIVASSTTGPNAGGQVTAAIQKGMLVGASTSFLSTNVEEHYVAIGFPSAPDARRRIAEPGSPLALLFDPARPEF